jgi:hypothetical protein
MCSNETYSKVDISIQNDLKKKILIATAVQLCFKYTIRNVQEKQVRLMTE